MNTEKLKERINESGYKSSFICEQMGITRQALWGKVNGKTQFTVDDANKLSKVLRLSAKEVTEIFFA